MKYVRRIRALQLINCSCCPAPLCFLQIPTNTWLAAAGSDCTRFSGDKPAEKSSNHPLVVIIIALCFLYRTVRHLSVKSYVKIALFKLNLAQIFEKKNNNLMRIRRGSLERSAAYVLRWKLLDGGGGGAFSPSFRQREFERCSGPAIWICLSD